MAKKSKSSYEDDDGWIDLDDALYSDDERLPLFDEVNRLRGGRERDRDY